MENLTQTEKQGWHHEPTLEDVLADPIVHLVMQRDRLNSHKVRPLLEDARARLLRRRAAH